MARRGEVNADLVRAPGLQLDGDQGRAVEPLDRAVARDRPLSLLAGPRDAAPEVAAVPHEVGGVTARIRQATLDDRQVLPLDRVAPEEVLKKMESGAVAREDEGAGSVLVQAVHHERGGAPAEAVVQVVENAREQRVLLVLGRGNGEQPGRLVHDQEVGVFGQNRDTRADPVPRRTARDGKRASRSRPPRAPGSSSTVPSTSMRPARTASRAARRERPNARDDGQVEPHGASALRDSNLDEEVGVADARVRPGAGPEEGDGIGETPDGGIQLDEVVRSKGDRPVSDGQDVDVNKGVGRVLLNALDRVLLRCMVEVAREELILRKRVRPSEGILEKTGLGEADDGSPGRGPARELRQSQP